LVKVLLVSGLLTHDSGKTWFSVGLAKYLVGSGFKVSMYKPVAAHNAWTQYFTVVKSEELKLLVGSDVLTYLSSGLVSVDELLLVNPVDLLLAPPDVINYLRRGGEYVHNYLTDLTNQFTQVVIARITSCTTNTYEHFRIDSNLGNVVSPLRDDLIELSRCLKSKSIDIKELINLLTSQAIESNLNTCLKRLSDSKDVVVVESFNDAITPYISLLNYVDVIALVSYGRVLLINDIGMVKELISRGFVGRGHEILRASNILKELKPSSIFEIKPSLHIERYDDVFKRMAKELMNY